VEAAESKQTCLHTHVVLCGCVSLTNEYSGYVYLFDVYSTRPMKAGVWEGRALISYKVTSLFFGLVALVLHHAQQKSIKNSGYPVSLPKEDKERKRKKGEDKKEKKKKVKKR